jgi:cytochrome c oxidase assembly factor CtaG
VAGYVIALIAFLLPFAFGITGCGRPRFVLAVGSVVAVGWVLSLAAARANDASGRPLVPVWFLTGLVVLLYAIWCGGLWLGLRLRRTREI